MAKCPSCGAENASGAKFCGQCAAAMTSGAAAASGPAAAAVTAAVAPITKGDLTGGGARGARYLLYGVFGLVILILALIQFALFVSIGGFGAFLIATVAAVLPVPIYGSLILWLDKHEREPSGLLIAAFIWGAVVATFFSLIGNAALGGILGAVLGRQAGELLIGPLVAPVVEETSKGIALLLLFFLMRHEFDNALDGIIYGALVGLGFAMTENVLYFIRSYQAGGLIGLGANFYVRVIMFGFGHAMFTGLTGLGLGISRETNRPTTKLFAPVGGYLAGVFAHSLWNFGATFFIGMFGQKVGILATLFVLLPLQTMVLGLPGLITLVIIAVLTWKREAKVITEQLKDEVASNIITAGEYAVVGNSRERLRRLLGALRSRGVQGWLALRHLYELETELAFRKWHTQRGERLPASQRNVSEDAFRQQIKAVRVRLKHLGIATA